MGEAARIWTTVGANIAPLKAGLAEAGAATNRFGRSFGSSMASHTKAMEKFGASWRRNITLPLVGTAAVATKMSLDFQKNMQLISTSAGASANDVKKLSKEILGLAQSGSSPYGPNELAKALYHLKSLGYDNATAMRTLKVAIKGAMTGQSDLESTTSALGAAIRTNIKGTGDFGKAMATLNAIVGAGNMKMDDLIGALGTGLLAPAKAAGLSLKDVGSALALMVDEGMSAESAATRLRQGFTLMASGSKQAEAALNRIGLSHNQLAQAMRGPAGLIGGIQLLKQHLDQLGGGDQIKRWAEQVDRGKMSLDEFTKMAQKTEQFDVLSHAFGGARSGTAIELLINNLGVLKQKYQQITDTAGQFNAKVKEAQQLDMNKLKESWAQVEASLIRAGAAITPFVVKAAKGLASLANWFAKLHDGTRKWLLIGAAAMTVGGPLLIFTAKLIDALKVIKGLFIAEQVVAKAATASVIADSAAQTAAIGETEAAVGALRLSFLGLAALPAIPLTVVLYELFKNRGQSNYNKVGGGVNHQVVVDKHGNIATTNVTANRGSHRTLNPMDPAAAQAALGSTVTGDYGGGNSDSPNRQNAIAYANKKRAQAALAAARVALQKKADASIAKLMGGNTTYTPPNMDSLMGGGGSGGKKGKSKVSTPKAKPVTNPIVAAAAEYLGVPYVWGGSSPAGFDCSGFVQYLYKKFGIDLPRTSQSQFKVGKNVALKNIKAGDVVFAPGHGDGGTLSAPGHEGLYIGGGRVESAPGTGGKVHITSLSSFIAGSGGLSGVRRFSNLSGDYTTGSVGRATSSYVKLADAGQVSKQLASFKMMMKEIGGLSGDEKTKATAAMKKIGKALVTVITPSDLSKVKGQMSTVQKVISGAVDRMRTVVDSKKQAFQDAFTRLAAAGANALDKELQSKLDAIDKTLSSKLAGIASQYASGPAEDALASFERQQQVSQLNSGLSDAQTAYTAALAGGDPQAIQDAAKQVKQAQDAITEDQLQQQADAEQKANQQSQQAAEDAANTDADVQKAALQDQYDRLKSSFDDQVSAIESGMEDGSIATATGLDSIKGLFVKFGIDLQSQGPIIAGTIYDTITGGLEGATTAAQDLAAALRTLNLLTNTPTSTSTSGGLSKPAGIHAGGVGGITARPFAKGGLVRHRPGGILANIGEGSEDEVVAPLSALGGMGGAQTINLTVQSVLDGQIVAESTHTHLLKKKKRTGALGLD